MCSEPGPSQQEINKSLAELDGWKRDKINEHLNGTPIMGWRKDDRITFEDPPEYTIDIMAVIKLEKKLKLYIKIQNSEDRITAWASRDWSPMAVHGQVCIMTRKEHFNHEAWARALAIYCIRRKFNV